MPDPDDVPTGDSLAAELVALDESWQAIDGHLGEHARWIERISRNVASLPAKDRQRFAALVPSAEPCSRRLSDTAAALRRFSRVIGTGDGK